jgi:hypothetical protein
MTPSQMRRASPVLMSSVRTNAGCAVEASDDPACAPSVPHVDSLLGQARLLAAPPRYAGLEAAHIALDAYAGSLARDEPLPVLTVTRPLDRVVEVSTPFYRWPASLFIPGAAIPAEYWLTNCPTDHRYTRDWTTAPANKADHNTGRLWAFIAARISDTPFVRTEAGVGFLFRPPYRLATYTVEPTVLAVGQHRWDVGDFAGEAGGTLRLRGWILTAAWDVSPVDGSLELTRPFGATVAFDHTYVNQGAISVVTEAAPWKQGPLPTNLVLEGSHTYLIGMVAMVQIDNDWTDSHGNSFTKPPDGATWRVWCQIDCLVDQVWVSPLVITLP